MAISRYGLSMPTPLDPSDNASNPIFFGLLSVISDSGRLLRRFAPCNDKWEIFSVFLLFLKKLLDIPPGVTLILRVKGGDAVNIKEAEKLSGVSTRNIRFYEHKGLLFPARNKENDYREYTPEDIARLKMIRALRMVDIPLEQIKRVADGEISMQEAVAKQKNELKQKIKKIKTAIDFCDELEKVEGQNVEEVLERMDQPENRKELSDKWKNEESDPMTKLAMSFVAGILFLVISYFTPHWVLLVGGLAQLVFGQREGIMWIVYMSPLLLWSYTAYRLYEKKWWWLQAIMAHLCLAALVFLPEGMELYTTKSFVLLAASPLLGLIPDLRDPSSLYAMQLCFWFIVGFFILGILIAMINSCLKKQRKDTTGKVFQYFDRHPRRKRVVKAAVILSFIVFVGSIKEFQPLIRDEAELTQNQEVAKSVSLSLNLVARDKEETWIFRASDGFVAVMSTDRWELADNGWGKGKEVIAVDIGYTEKYLTFYENDIVRVYDGDNPWGFARYVYYTLPDGVMEEVEDFVYKNKLYDRK